MSSEAQTGGAGQPERKWDNEFEELVARELYYPLYARLELSNQSRKVHEVVDALRHEPARTLTCDTSINIGSELQDCLNVMIHEQIEASEIERQMYLLIFCQGFWAAEYTLGFTRQDNANIAATEVIDEYREWASQTIQERCDEMLEYFHNIKAGVSVSHLLHPKGAIQKAMRKNMVLSVDDQQWLIKGKDQNIIAWRTEGILAALYLMKHHIVMQQLEAETFGDFGPEAII